MTAATQAAARLQGWIRASSGFLLRHLDRTGRLPARHDGVDGAGSRERCDLRALSACMVALSDPQIERAWSDDPRRAAELRQAVRRMLAIVLKNLAAEGADGARARPPALHARAALVLARTGAGVPGGPGPVDVGEPGAALRMLARLDALDPSDPSFCAGSAPWRHWFAASRDAFSAHPRLAFAATHAPLWLVAGRRAQCAEMVDFALILAEWVSRHQRLTSAQPQAWGGIAGLCREPGHATAEYAVALVCGVEAARCNGDRFAEHRLRRMASAAFDFMDSLRAGRAPGAAAAIIGGVRRSVRDPAVMPQAVAALLRLACAGLSEPAWQSP